jgi:chemotaxis protein CheD
LSPSGARWPSFPGTLGNTERAGCAADPGLFNSVQEAKMNKYYPEVATVYLKPGELIVCEHKTLVTTVLGSCISVTMFHPERHIGAMCHALLPHEKAKGEAFRYVDTSIQNMLERFAEYGINRSRIEVKLFGGAEMLIAGRNSNRSVTVGRKNIEVALQVIEAEQLRLVASDFGGTQGRKIHFHTYTGEIFLKRLRKYTEP